MLRGFLAIALAAKFLMPVGYMPASLADGGLPITLCDSVFAAFFEERARAGGAADHAAHGDADAHGASSHFGAAGPGHADGHDHRDSSAGHSDREHCALGGLAALAAIASNWDFTIAPLPAARLARSDAAVTERHSFRAFRSRAPPFTHA